MKKKRLALVASAVVLGGSTFTAYAPPTHQLPEPGSTLLFTVLALAALLGLARFFR